MKLINAKSVTAVTLVGFSHDDLEPPYEYGNCFSVKAEDGREYRILNFSYENLQELQARGVGFPIRIKVIRQVDDEKSFSRNLAIFYDTRIPNNWYSEWCSCCCPPEFLPEPQKMKWELQVERGTIVVKDRHCLYDYSKEPKL
jgi:hypothetical protein